jgi:epidermal growth factor receptor substrate 15
LLTWFRILLLFFGLLFTASCLFSQVEPSVSLSPEESEVYKRSVEAFNMANYDDAYAGFSQLLSWHSKEIAFKYYFSVCMIKLRRDFNRTDEYLKESAAQGIYQANFFLGETRHIQYNFSKAIEYYNKFKESARLREIRETDVDRHIRMAENGLELIKYAYELKVVNNRTINKQNFHYSYDFSDFGGRIIVKPDRYRTRPDRSIKEPDLMYISDRHNVIYMSSYGARRGGSKNIYKIEQHGADWGEPEILPSPINDDYDQAYPFIAADGVTLYFSSKGHNSMGGYDIFKSVFDTISRTWTQPENLDFPINTPFDDVMYVADVFNETAFFSSDRDARDNRITIYRILLEKEPQKRLVASIDDVYRHAKLEVDMSAVTELEKRETQRELFEKDSVQIDMDTILAQADEQETKSQLIDDAREMLDSVNNVSDISSKYIASGYLQSKNAVEQIGDIRKTIDGLPEGNEKQLFEQKLVNTALTAVVMYDLSRAGESNKQRIDAQKEYYQRELRNLEDAKAKGQDIDKQLQELNNNLNRISVQNPKQLYISEKDKELAENQNRLEIINNQIDDLSKNAEYLKNQKDSLVNIALASNDRNQRQSIIDNIKTIEYNQVEINEHLKNYYSNKEIILRESEIIRSEIAVVEKLPDLISDFGKEPNISELQNEIEMIRIFLNQENLKLIAEVQKEISKSYTFTPEIDEIIAKVDKISNEEDRQQAEIMKSVYKETTEVFISETLSPAKEQIFELRELIEEQNLLKEQIADLETDFDISTIEQEKLEILDKLSVLNNKLKSTETIITQRLDGLQQIAVPQIDRNEYMTMRTEALNYPELNNTLAEADNLISVLDELQERIVYFEKSGVFDKKAEHEVLKIIEQQLSMQLDEKQAVINVYIGGQKLFETGEIADVIEQNINQSLEESNIDINELENLQKMIIIKFDEINELTNTIQNSSNQRRIDKANETLEQIIPEHLQVQNAYLNKKLNAVSTKLDVYRQLGSKYKYSIPEQATILLAKAEKLNEKSEELIGVAAETNNLAEQNKLLTLAEVNKELAVLNYQAAFDMAMGKITITQAENIEVKKEITEMMQQTEILSDNLNSQDTDVSSEDIMTKPEFVQDNTMILELMDDIQRAERSISFLIEDYEQASFEDKKIIVNKIDSINNKLQTLLVEAKRTVIDMQREQIMFNQENFADNLDDRNYLNRYNEYIEKVDENINQYSYLLLDEIVIMGESVLNLQQERIEMEISTQPIEADIKDFYKRSEDKIAWVSAEKIVIEKQDEEDLIAQNEEDSIDVDSEDQTQDTDITNEDQTQDTDVSIIEYDYVEQETILNQSPETLNYTREYAESAAEQIEEYNKLVTEVNRINSEIASVTSNRDRNELIQQKEQLENSQRSQLTEISNVRKNMIENLKLSAEDKISNKNTSDYIEFKTLIDEAESMRKTIADFGSFHDQQKLAELNYTALEKENKAMQYYEKMLETESETDLISLNQETDIHTDEVYISTVDIEPIVLDTYIQKNERIKFENLEDLERERNVLLTENKNLLSEIDELNLRAAQTGKSRKVRKIKKEIANLESKYIDNLKDITRREVEIIGIKHEIALNIYDTTHIAGELNRHISDSVKSTSLKDRERAMMFYDFVLNYQANTLSPELRRNYEIAGVNAEESLEKIQHSINIRQITDEEDAIIAAYIKTVESHDQLVDADSESIDTLSTETQPVDEFIDTQTEVTETVQILADEREQLSISEDISVSHYSDSNPIQEIEERQEGLNYRIQIGAFNRPVPNETFKGISPILIERPPGSNLLRYVVGIFYTYRTAVAALPSVRTLGYNDCFVVAYYNGERIPLYRARQIESAQETETRLIAEGIIIERTETETVDTVTVIHTDINQSSGAFYCVQIGVYRSLVSPADLYGLAPLEYDRLDNGLVRHLFGKYTDYNQAVNQQNRIRRLGISDAFVVAYSNGKRVSMAEARRLIVSSGESEVTETATVSTDTEPVITTPETTTDDSEDIVSTTEIGTETNAAEDEVIAAEKPVYYVQVGAYRTRLSEIVRTGFNDISSGAQLFEVVSDNGLFIYRIGEFSNYESALQMQNTARNAGINDAFIIATLNDQRINVGTARSME